MGDPRPLPPRLHVRQISIAARIDEKGAPEGEKMFSHHVLLIQSYVLVPDKCTHEEVPRLVHVREERMLPLVFVAHVKTKKTHANMHATRCITSTCCDVLNTNDEKRRPIKARISTKNKDDEY